MAGLGFGLGLGLGFWLWLGQGLGFGLGLGSDSGLDIGLGFGLGLGLGLGLRLELGFRLCCLGVGFLNYYNGLGLWYLAGGGKVFGCDLGFWVERFWIGMKILEFGGGCLVWGLEIWLRVWG